MMRRFGALFFACHFNGTFNLPYAPLSRLIKKYEIIPIIDGGGTLALEKVLWYYSDGSPMTSSSTSAQYFASAFGNNFILDTHGHGTLGSNYQILYKSQLIDNNGGLYIPMYIKYI